MCVSGNTKFNVEGVARHKQKGKNNFRLFDFFFFFRSSLSTSPVSLLHHFRLLDDEPPFLVALGLLEGLLVLPSEDGGAA